MTFDASHPHPAFSTFLNDGEFIAAWKELREAALLAMAGGAQEMALRWPPGKVMALCDEVLNQRPRNMSYLIKDDFLDRANALLDRMHEEVLFVIAAGPAETVSERMRADRKRHLPASNALRDSLKNKPA